MKKPSKKKSTTAQRARSLNLRVIAAPPENQPPTPPVTMRVIDGDSQYRKMFPLTTGCLDYFPDALAEVARGSFVGNLKHNPGQPMHHSRGKSNDHADCIMRHLGQRGTFDVVVIDGEEHLVRHSTWVAWRALALLQEELEHDLNLPLPRGAKAAD